jgi:hypothetical protein
MGANARSVFMEGRHFAGEFNKSVIFAMIAQGAGDSCLSMALVLLKIFEDLV